MSDNVGQSYNEQILQSIIDGEPYTNENPYPSRIEVLLMELKEAIEGGGGSVVVDQTYSAESTNAQSGTAVAEALETIPAQINADWDATEGAAVILNKPTIPAAQVQADWNQTTTTAIDYIKNKPSLATVATSGSYADLTNKPTIPAAQVNADWNAVSGVAQILNKPTIPTQVTVDQTYDATSTNAQSGVAIAGVIGDINTVLEEVL